MHRIIAMKMGGVLGLFGVSIFILLGPAWGADRSIPLHRDGSGQLFVGRKSLDSMIRQDIGLMPGTRILVENLPKHFQGPMGKDLSAVLHRQENFQDGRYRYRLNILEGGVARETFYLRVRVPKAQVKLGQSSLSFHSADQLKSGGGEVKDLVHTGDMVRVTVRGQGFQIGFSGISQGEGEAGDQVPIVIPVSGRTLRGEITGHDKVMVDLSGSPS